MKKRVVAVAVFCVLLLSSCGASTSDNLTMGNITTTLAVPWETTVTETVESTTDVGGLAFAPMLITPTARATLLSTPEFNAVFSQYITYAATAANLEKAYNNCAAKFVIPDDIALDVVSEDVTNVLKDYVLTNFGTNVAVNLSDDRFGSNSLYVISSDGTPYYFCVRDQYNNGLVPAFNDQGDISSFLADYADVGYSFVLKGRYASFYATCVALHDKRDDLINPALSASLAGLLQQRIETTMRRYAISVNLPNDLEPTYQNVCIYDLFNDPALVLFNTDFEQTLERSDILPRWHTESFWQDALASDYLLQYEYSQFKILGIPLEVDEQDSDFDAKFDESFADILPELMEDLYLMSNFDKNYVLDSLSLDKITHYRNGDMTAQYHAYWNLTTSNDILMCSAQLHYDAMKNCWNYIPDLNIVYSTDDTTTE